MARRIKSIAEAAAEGKGRQLAGGAAVRGGGTKERREQDPRGASEGAAEESLAKRQATLPTEEVAKDLELIERELEIAEAALGGGLSVVVRPRAAVQLRAFVDPEGTRSTRRALRRSA